MRASSKRVCLIIDPSLLLEQSGKARFGVPVSWATHEGVWSKCEIGLVDQKCRNAGLQLGNKRELTDVAVLSITECYDGTVLVEQSGRRDERPCEMLSEQQKIRLQILARDIGCQVRVTATEIRVVARHEETVFGNDVSGYLKAAKMLEKLKSVRDNG